MDREKYWYTGTFAQKSLFCAFFFWFFSAVNLYALFLYSSIPPPPIRSLLIWFSAIHEAEVVLHTTAMQASHQLLSSITDGGGKAVGFVIHHAALWSAELILTGLKQQNGIFAATSYNASSSPNFFYFVQCSVHVLLIFHFRWNLIPGRISAGAVWR